MPGIKALNAGGLKPSGCMAGSDGRPWDDEDFDPQRENWEPEPLDDEPDPEPGDFWLDPDAFDE